MDDAGMDEYEFILFKEDSVCMYVNRYAKPHLYVVFFSNLTR
jgi:hypothetical protein